MSIPSRASVDPHWPLLFCIGSHTLSQGCLRWQWQRRLPLRVPQYLAKPIFRRDWNTDSARCKAVDLHVCLLLLLPPLLFPFLLLCVCKCMYWFSGVSAAYSYIEGLWPIYMSMVMSMQGLIHITRCFVFHHIMTSYSGYCCYVQCYSQFLHRELLRPDARRWESSEWLLSGKLRVRQGVLHPASGTLRFDGAPWRGNRPHSSVARQQVCQARGLPPGGRRLPPAGLSVEHLSDSNPSWKNRQRR